MNLLDYLTDQGHVFKKTAATHGGEYSGPCPKCGGEDRFQVWPHHPESLGGRFWCRGCKLNGDWIQYLRDFEGRSFQEACEIVGKPLNRPKGEIKPAFGEKKFKAPDQGLADRYHKALTENTTALNYLRDRGINYESIKRHKLGFCFKDGSGWLTIPHFQDGQLFNVKFRSLPPAEKEFKRLTGCKSILFNSDVLKDQKEVFIAEGELDAISLIQADIENTVSGTTGAESFDPEWLDQLKDFQKVYLAYDADEAGRKGARSLAKRLGYDRCINIELPDGQDLNNFFNDGNIDFDFFKLMDSARKFDLPGVISIRAAIDLLEREEVSGELESGLSTPWDNVNKLVKGFYPGDLIVISSLSKTGKTTWTLEISRTLVRKYIPVLFYCLEMRPERLIRKVIEAEYRREEITLKDIQTARKHFSDWPLYFVHTFKKQQLEDVIGLIREAIKRFDLKLVVFDNLHFLIRSIQNVNEELGQAVQSFKLLAEEMELPIIVVAQPRKREVGNKSIMSAEDIKYSNAVHADCDLMIILHRNRLASKTSDLKPEGFTGKQQALDPVTLVRVEAHRYGAGGETLLFFHGEYSRFDPVERVRKAASGG